MESPPLTPELLVAAYANGVFPMDVDGEIQWFSPDPRAIIPLDGFHASKTLMQTCRQGKYEVRVDAAFEEVIRACADREDGTWISEEIVDAYTRLHRLGLAHSVETWRGDELAGGLYGVALGGAFFGESMFSRQRDASKVALVALVDRLRDGGFKLLDIQFLTDHLARFGAMEIPRPDYLARLEAALRARPASFV
ncbi:MAG: leucyl/phenylalanyl-tRNA--protein transferase [Planctomycetes bacterium]|nr:leucyl/phenylalanyl-tRNA--protein transferase [Planctomycetota bacterium]